MLPAGTTDLEGCESRHIHLKRGDAEGLPTGIELGIYREGMAGESIGAALHAGSNRMNLI